MNKPTGKLLFAYNTITELNSRILELENELRTLLVTIDDVDYYDPYLAVAERKALKVLEDAL